MTTKIFKSSDRVSLASRLNEYPGILTGTHGTVIGVFATGNLYLVEFDLVPGRSTEVATTSGEDLEHCADAAPAITQQDIDHLKSKDASGALSGWRKLLGIASTEA